MSEMFAITIESETYRADVYTDAWERVKAERDAALAVIEELRDLGKDITEKSHCAHLGKDILFIINASDPRSLRHEDSTCGRGRN